MSIVSRSTPLALLQSTVTEPQRPARHTRSEPFGMGACSSAVAAQLSPLRAPADLARQLGVSLESGRAQHGPRERLRGALAAAEFAAVAGPGRAAQQALEDRYVDWAAGVLQARQRSFGGGYAIGSPHELPQGDADRHARRTHLARQAPVDLRALVPDARPVALHMACHAPEGGAARLRKEYRAAAPASREQAMHQRRQLARLQEALRERCQGAQPRGAGDDAAARARHAAASAIGSAAPELAGMLDRWRETRVARLEQSARQAQAALPHLAATLLSTPRGRADAGLQRALRSLQGLRDEAVDTGRLARALHDLKHHAAHAGPAAETAPLLQRLETALHAMAQREASMAWSRAHAAA